MLVGCQSNIGKIVKLDGRLLNEFNESIQLGGLYYEEPLRNADEPVSLDDICLIVNGLHNVSVPTPKASKLIDKKITIVRNGKVSGNAAGGLGSYIPVAFKLGAEANNIEFLRINLTNIQKFRVANAQLSAIRKDLRDPRRKDCPRYVQNVSNSGREIYQVKALYYANVDIELKIIDGASANAGLDAIKIEARVKGELNKQFNSVIVGERNLIAVDLEPMKKWALFDS